MVFSNLLLEKFLLTLPSAVLVSTSSHGINRGSMKPSEGTLQSS
ncbi:hypothetical protein SynSYN20_01549 [Synechococcus sp. SYN20]|nr:hypothetical protein SynSYN20_01549 [Synechococcus sp. SYN20]